MKPLRNGRSTSESILAKARQILPYAGLAASFVVGSPALAEGSYQAGLNQWLFEYDASNAFITAPNTRPIKVDILSAGEVINVSLCGYNDSDGLRIEIYNPSGTQVLTRTLTSGNVLCADTFTAPLTNPVRYTTTTTGTYEVRLFNLNTALDTAGPNNVFKRFDITVTPNATTNPDPRQNLGRVWATSWAFNGSETFLATGATNADYYVRVPGGHSGTEYVWQLDLNVFAAQRYEIIGNSIGVNAPNSAYSVPGTGNTAARQFPIYLSYPAAPIGAADTPPTLSNVSFIDNAGVDSTISPGSTTGIQDSGFFQFTTDITGNYAIVVDTNKDGTYGPTDRFLFGSATPGTNSIAWDGRDASGAVLPVGNYNIQVQVRSGEYHFVAYDAETSGGGAGNGLTIFRALGGGATANTQVYWDDVTRLGTTGGTTNLPGGTSAGRHTWGNFAAGSIGDGRYMDTYVYGASSATVTTATIATTDVPDLTITKTHTGNFTQGSTGTYTITATNSGGGTTTGTVTVSDTLPTGLTPTAATGTGWNCTISGQTVTCTRSNALAVGVSYPAISVSVAVASNAPASVTNTATVAGGGETNTANNSANDPTTITQIPDLVVSKTHTGNFTRGLTGSYSITVSNAGGLATSGTVTVSDTLPAGLTLNGVPSGTGWTCTNTSTTAFSCTRSNALAPASSYPAITASVTVAQTAANSVTNTATVSGGGETNTTNNSANDVTTIASTADLSITKTDNQTTTIAGGSISYTITVTNNGPSTLNSVTVTDTVPTAIQNPVFTPSTGSYDSSTGAWTGLNLASGQSIILTMTGTVASTAGGTLTNTATVTPPSGATDPTATNNTATDNNTNIYAVSPTAGRVVINEVLYQQTTSMNDEFIEIYNASSSSISLNGWRLADGNLIDGTTDGGSGNLSYTFPADKTLAPGEYAVIWLGNNIATNQATGAAFQVWLGLASTRLNDAGDDIWLYDDQLRIVDYVAYGSGTSINTPPPASFNLWNATYQASLSGASAGQSISLTANGVDGNTSACWESTTSGQANGRCTGYLPTRDTDTTGSRITSGGQNNNGAVVTPPSLLLVKRITALNGVNITTIVDDSTSTNDNAANWPTPIDSASGISSYLRGAINGGTVRPGDIVEYTIYFLSNGGSPATNVNLCDLVPANSTFIPTSFSSSPQSGIALAIGTTTTNLTNTSDADNGAYFASGAAPSTTCAAANTNGAVVVSVVKSPSTLPNATAPGTLNSYGFIRFRARVN